MEDNGHKCILHVKPHLNSHIKPETFPPYSSENHIKAASFDKLNIPNCKRMDANNKKNWYKNDFRSFLCPADATEPSRHGMAEPWNGLGWRGSHKPSNSSRNPKLSQTNVPHTNQPLVLLPLSQCLWKGSTGSQAPGKGVCGFSVPSIHQPGEKTWWKISNNHGALIKSLANLTEGLLALESFISHISFLQQIPKGKCDCNPTSHKYLPGIFLLGNIQCSDIGLTPGFGDLWDVRVENQRSVFQCRQHSRIL